MLKKVRNQGVQNYNFLDKFSRKWKSFIAGSVYQPGCEIRNLFPKTGIQKFLRHFCMSYVITQVDTSFWCNFSQVWAIFSHF